MLTPESLQVVTERMCSWIKWEVSTSWLEWIKGNKSSKECQSHPRIDNINKDNNIKASWIRFE